MTHILGLSGSLRKASINSALLRAASDLAPDGAGIVIGDIQDVPLYNGDIENAQGLPDAVRRLQDQLVAADGLLLVTPEYNNGIPGVFKNVIDWMSRGEGLAAFDGKPVALIGASPGGFGTILSQNGWLPVLRALKAEIWKERMLVSRAGQLFDASGDLTDGKTRDRLRDFVAGFVASI